jgi:hypothetical protein
MKGFSCPKVPLVGSHVRAKQQIPQVCTASKTDWSVLLRRKLEVQQLKYDGNAGVAFRRIFVPASCLEKKGCCRGRELHPLPRAGPFCLSGGGSRVLKPHAIVARRHACASRPAPARSPHFPERFERAGARPSGMSHRTAELRSRKGTRGRRRPRASGRASP